MEADTKRGRVGCVQSIDSSGASGGITFEKPQFKLTKDIADVFGGRGSPLWEDFIELMVAGVQASWP